MYLPDTAPQGQLSTAQIHFRDPSTIEGQSDNPCLMPGSSLLSHGETPHYHRRFGVSLLSSAWGQVGPPRYRRQANSVLSQPSQFSLQPSEPIFEQAKISSSSLKHLRCCKVKPLGSLVPVSSTHRCAYTPGLSTSSSSTALQGTQSPREDSSRGKFPA